MLQSAGASVEDAVLAEVGAGADGTRLDSPAVSAGGDLLLFLVVGIPAVG